MAILKIAKMGDPVLRAPAREVDDPADPMVQALVRDMVETMVDAGGVGLAAPQVHVPLRIVIFHEPPAEPAEGGGEGGNGSEGGDADADGDGADGDTEDAGERDVGTLHVLINPVIEPVGEETELGWEGCLSVPGMRGVVPRFTRIRYKGLGLDGREIAREAEGFFARVVQHECDHIDGILYPQRITDLRLFGFNEEFERHPLEGPGGADAAAEEDAGAAAAAREI